MDTIARKLLEDDEVDSMHPGPAVEALTAALNRDIGMDVAAPSISQPSDPPGTLGALVTDSNSTSNQLISEWQATSQEDHTTHQTQQLEQQKDFQAQDQHLSLLGQPKQPQNVQDQQHVDSQSENENLTVQQENLFTDQLQLPKDQSNEITKENFLRVIRNIVGDQMLRQAAQKVQQQISVRNSPIASSQHQLQASQQQTSRSAQQFVEGQLISQVHSLSSMQHQRGQISTSVQQVVEVDVRTDMGTAKPSEVDNQIDAQGHRPDQVSSTNVNVMKQESDVSLVSVQAVNKLQPPPQLPPSSLSLCGGTANFHSHEFPRPPGTALVTSRKSQSRVSQMRQLTLQGIITPQSGATQPMNIMNTSKYELQSSVTGANRNGGTGSHLTSHLSPLKNQVTWQSSTIKEQKASTLSTMSFVKQEVAEQTVEQQGRPQLSVLQGSFGAVQIDQGSPALSSSKDETDEKQPSRISFSPSTSTVMTNQTSGCMTSQLESGTQVRSQIPSAALPVAAGTTMKTPPKKPSVGQKKPLESQGTPLPASKKQKVSGTYHDQSIEQLNDVTAVSGVNLREEEEQLLSAPKEESRASEATRRVVQEEEERLILIKGPLQKKLAEIMSKCGIKNMNSDVERCLSLCVEERLRGLMSNLIRVSRQRVDIEKERHRIVFTSDVRRQILMMNKRAKDVWEKKQAEETEKLRKQNEGEGITGADAEKEKDEGGRSKSLKCTKEEDDKMRTTAANVAARAAVGGDDMLSKWQLMAEQARQKREGGLDTISGALPGSTTSRTPSSNLGRTSRENQEVETKSPSVVAGVMRKFGRIMPHPQVVRSISAKDVVAVLEREPQMTKSSLIYRLYDRMSGNPPTE